MAWLLLLSLLLASPLGVRAQFLTVTNDGGITITRYTSDGKDLNIPATLGGLPVVSIGPTAFQSCGFTNVTIPESVTSIGFGAFSGSAVVEVTIPKGVTNIGEVAFSSWNFKSINVDPLNSTYSSVDGVLFDKNRTKLIQFPEGRGGAYAVPDGVITIGDTAFGGNFLTSVTIPDSVAVIEWHAFASCGDLTNIMIGSGVTNIGYDSAWLPFNGSAKLTAINVGARNRVFSSADGVLIDKSKNALVKFPEGKAGSYAIPNTVTTIADHAFAAAANLTSIVIPDSVENIEANAFENCGGLTNVTFGHGIKSIGESAFVFCAHLASIKLPDSLVSVGAGAFYFCNSLTNVAVGKNVARIGKNAFQNNAALVVDSLNPNYGSEKGSLIDKRPGKLSVSFTGPANGAAIDAMCVDVQGVFKGEKVKQITVAVPGFGGQMPATVSGNTFEARNVFLQPGTNKIMAIIEDFEGNEASNALAVIGPAQANTRPTLPVQLTLTPNAGFAPLTVTLKVDAHVPGKIQKVFYDFDGDGIADETKSDVQPITHTYKTGTEYFPVVTIQTSVGRFSSVSGMMVLFAILSGQNPSFSVNVQTPPVVLSTLKVTDPVDVKWTATSNLYVLSGSTATLTEFSADGRIIRSKNQLGSNPSGFAVDAEGNVYVAVTGKNQVWKYKPTADSFEPDTSFGSGGFIGNKDGSPGAGPGQFNEPFDVVLSSGRPTLSVSDSGNQRVQSFSIDGAPAEDSRQNAPSFFKTPKGLSYGNIGFYLLVVDSGNGRIALTENTGGFIVFGTSGTNGSELSQFNGPMHLSVNNRGIYVADTGNNRVQVFGPVQSGEGTSPVPFQLRIALSQELGLNHPKAVAAVKDLLEEKFYIADTGNNRVILVKLPADSPEAVWKELVSKMKSGDVEGAVSCFSISSREKYQQIFAGLPKEELQAMVKDMEHIQPVTIENDEAEYRFESVVQGTTITFPVHFDKEFGRWKVMEY